MAQPMHGISMYGEPALPPDFTHLPYANPDAPTGGRIVTGEVGSFDSLNPHIRQGSVPWQLRFLAYESLMGRSWDEPFALYGLLAESVEVDPNHMWVEFTLRPEARFSDGSPVTVEDVIWSYETLGTEGHPRYLNAWTRVASIEATGERSVRITFTEADRELALIMGLRPILKAAQWEGVDFAESGLDRIPIATAPYVIDDFEAGRFVSLRRNPDYWGADLPFRRGTNVIDEVRMEFFSDGTAMFEAFTSGILTTMRETNAAELGRELRFPPRAVGRGGPVGNPPSPPLGHHRPRDEHAARPVRRLARARGDDPGLQFRVHQPDAQRRDRAADHLLLLQLAARHAARSGGGQGGGVPRTLRGDLLPGAMEGYVLPVSDGSERNRAGIAEALRLFEEAGYTVENGVMTAPTARPSPSRSCCRTDRPRTTPS
jgi:peptide/nickel transport system substrate-binding protein